MAIEKSTGTTKTEKELNRVGEKSFLKLWSYSNTFKKDGKELCDFITVFGDHIILFEDKDCKFPQKGKGVEVDWNNWYLNSVRAAAKQINKAESYLNKNYPIFLDNKCNQLLPIEIPSESTRKIIRIIVARNSSDRCAEFYDEKNSASLLLNMNLIKENHMNQDGSQWPWNPSPNYRPFTIGYVNSPSAGFIHVLDDVSFPIIFDELDTIDEFVKYFLRKEKYISSGLFAGAVGEEELVGYYLAHTDSKREHRFPNKMENDGTPEKHFLEEGYWKHLKSHPQYLAKKEANKISYLWDNIIDEEFTKHLFQDTLFLSTESEFRGVEATLRKMASENRTNRRHFSEQIMSARKMTSPKQYRVRVIMEKKSNYAYIYLLFPYLADVFETYEEYRLERQSALLIHAMVLKKEHLYLKEIIGIATETPSDNNYLSHDLLCYSTENWSKEEYEEAERMQKELNIFIDSDLKLVNLSIEEYPQDLVSVQDENSIFTIQRLMEKIEYSDPVRAEGLNVLVNKMQEDEMDDKKIKYALTKLTNQKVNVPKD